MIIHIKYQGSLHVVVQINANVKMIGYSLFGHRAIISIICQRSTGRCYIPNIKALDLEVSDKICVYAFPIYAYVEHITHRLGRFLSHIHKLNKHCRGRGDRGWLMQGQVDAVGIK